MPTGVPSKASARLIKELYVKEKKSCRQIAKQLHCDRGMVARTLREMGVSVAQVKRWGIKTEARIGDLIGSFWVRIVRCAYKRGIPVELTQEDAWDLFVEQGGKCALTGTPLSLPLNRREYYGKAHNASLDRKNSSISYSKANCQWVTKKVNLAKGTMSDEELIEMGRDLVRHNGWG